MTDKNRPKERRLHTRYSVEGVVDLGAGQEGAATLRDLSMSGLACSSPVPFEEMAILEIRMELPVEDRLEPFTAGGAVVRSEPEDGGRFGVAVFFTHMDDESRNVLEAFVASRRT